MAFYQGAQIITLLLTGLMAGLFYSYACSVTGALGRLPDKEYVMAFQSINTVILNAWFFAGFMGSLIVLPMTTWLSYRYDMYFSFYLLLSATMMYVVGVFGVTIFGNVPLNNMLEHFPIETATPKDLFSLREMFETPWNKLNLIRTIAAIISFVLTIISIKLKA
ncbi:anthrone oxygenase family protein [Algoriphagus resistens]|uniref:anthrone oxygenase family protein n=1 Tax=Algoriphagus resistens TaxID=1750590 RepID=UPI0007169A01|nr:anthrone oxygenase family protein [Algoriphagus resistens]